MLNEEPRIDHHAHAGEENDGKQILERNRLGSHTVRDLRPAHNDTGEKRPEREGQVEQPCRQDRRSQRHNDNGKLEQLAWAKSRYADGHMRKRTRAHHEHQAHEERRLCERRAQPHRSRRGIHLTRPKQHRQHHEDHHREQVLHDKPSGGDPAPVSASKTGIGKVLDEHDRRGDGHRKPQTSRPPQAANRAQAPRRNRLGCPTRSAAAPPVPPRRGRP